MATAWKPLGEALTALESEVLEAEVLWGADIRSLFGELRLQIGSLRFAVEHHIRKQADQSQWRGGHREFDQEQTFVLHSAGRPDEFWSKLEEIVFKFEGTLQPHLATRSTSGTGWWDLPR